MGENITRKILRQHRVEGNLETSSPLAIRMDQTLTQDATGTMAYLQFEAMGVERVRTRLSVSYVDHNMLQTGFENADDHEFLRTVAARYGIHFSRPGNGICHQVHLERFGRPGETLLGSDSHTPTAGGIGMLAIGAGGLDVAVAMAGGPFHLTMPKVVGVRLVGSLPPWVGAKDVILEMLRRLTVKGGVGRIFEYIGEGVASLSVPERATITNMGAELGATASLFPSDERTRAFLEAQGRGGDFVPLTADPDATYDEEIVIDLSLLEPLVAQPHSPDRVAPVREVGEIPVNQVAIGSCTNSSYTDLMRVASILKGKTIHPEVSLVISPGSKQVLTMLAENGGLATLIEAGARIIESACGPCIGMGQAPGSGAVSVRTFNRNFEGRSGTADAGVYLAGPEVAATAALTGRLVDPRHMGAYPQVSMPAVYHIQDNGILSPPADGGDVQVKRGPNIRPLPKQEPLPGHLSGEILLKVGDNITTDHIMPAGTKVLPLRSNIPAISRYVFERIDPTFAERSEAAGGGFVVGGQNYGQGSSREHAALAPRYLGVRAVLVRSFARIHRANLINFGILPLEITEEDLHRLHQGERLHIEGLGRLAVGQPVRVRLADGGEFLATHSLTQREIAILQAGGLLSYTRQQGEKALV